MIVKLEKLYDFHRHRRVKRFLLCFQSYLLIFPVKVSQVMSDSNYKHNLKLRVSQPFSEETLNSLMLRDDQEDFFCS